MLLLRTAAYFHDIGFVEQRDEHERCSMVIAGQILPRYGYDMAAIASIQGTILAICLPQTPRTPLEAMLADADLELLGRSSFLARNHALRAALAAFGTVMSDEQWYQHQLRFLESHRYFTAAARSTLEQTKQTTIAQLRALLATCRAG